MKKHFIDFMQKMFDAGQAEPAPPLKGVLVFAHVWGVSPSKVGSDKSGVRL